MVVGMLLVYSLAAAAPYHSYMRWRWIPVTFHQSWGMFAPAPFKEDGWFVVAGTLKSGERVNCLRPERPLSWKKPKYVFAEYESGRWRNYIFKLYRNKRQREERLENYCSYLCEQWNQSEGGPRKLVEVTVHFMLEKTPPPGHPWDEVQKLSLWQHSCHQVR